MSEDWNSFHRRWSQLKPPLRANDEVIAAIRQAISGHDEHALLLGVTPELANIARRTTAVDKSQTMVDHIWPGDTDKRRAIPGNWLAMPLQQREFTAVIGDGSLNSIAYGENTALFAQLEKLLLPKARLAMRIYLTPQPGQSVADLRAQTMAGKAGGFHAFKWRLATAITAEDREATIAVTRIHEIFEREFPDRAALSAASGWSIAQIAEIDSYRGSSLFYSFPTPREILAALPKRFSHPRFVPSGTYEWAEHCPLLVADFVP